MQREQESGVARLKWDAKVRIKQAKLRADGENKRREEVIQVIIDESIKAAKHGVIKRFDEIVRERSLSDSIDGELSWTDA